MNEVIFIPRDAEISLEWLRVFIGRQSPDFILMNQEQTKEYRLLFPMPQSLYEAVMPSTQIMFRGIPILEYSVPR